MASRRRVCYLCGEHYEFCPSCAQDRNKPAFMSVFHEKNCSDIFDICTRFNMGLLTKEETKDLLNKCDLSNRENFRDCIKKDLDNIFGAVKNNSDRDKKNKISK